MRRLSFCIFCPVLFQQISFKRKYVFLMRKRKNDIETLKQERESLRKLIFQS